MAVIRSAPGPKGNPPSGARSGTLKQQRQALRTYQTEQYGLASTAATTSLLWTQIRTNGGTQMRAGLNQETVGEYADVMRHNNSYEPFPALTVFYDGETYWLADGFHRHRAAYEAFDSGCTVPVDVRTGTRRDAVLYAAQANAKHGLRRTNADKQRAVDTLLQDEEWSQWSDNEIARRCAVSPTFVGKRRVSLSTVDSETLPTTEQSAVPQRDSTKDKRVYKTKHGTTTTMNTNRIGKRAHTSDAQGSVTAQAVPATVPKGEPRDETDWTKSKGEAPTVTQRLPAYLAAAGCTLGTQLDGSLLARYQENERIFPANQAGESLGPAITWLDTLVRTTSAAIDREQRRLLVLATHAITDLREARDIAFGSHYHQQAAQLAEVIDLINKVITALEGDNGIPYPATTNQRRNLEEIRSNSSIA